MLVTFERASSGELSQALLQGLHQVNNRRELSQAPSASTSNPSFLASISRVSCD